MRRGSTLVLTGAHGEAAPVQWLLVPWSGRAPTFGRSAGTRRGATVAFLVLPPALFGEYTLDPLPQLAAAALLMALLVLVALRLPGRPSLWNSHAELLPRRRGVAPVAFTATAANFLLMGLSDIDVPWPLAVLAVLTPVLVAFLFIRTRVSGPVFGRDGLRVVSGILGFYCVFAIGVGLTGRYDVTLGALAVVVLLWRLRGRVRVVTPRST